MEKMSSGVENNGLNMGDALSVQVAQGSLGILVAMCRSSYKNPFIYL